MTGKSAESRPGQRQIQLELKWATADHLEPVFVDNVHLGRVNDQFYLTFGQIRLSVEDTPSRAVLHPMARLVLTREALERLNALLNRNLEKLEKGEK